MNCKLIAVAFAACFLAACASTEQGSAEAPASASAPASTSSNESYCDSSGLQAYLGQRFEQSTAERAQSSAGARTLRVLQPGQVMTMEYNPARLTIVVDDAGNIGSARCG